MVKGTMNQLYNIGNVNQTDERRVLTVCSAGLLRSPTAANVLHIKYGYNTRACGTHDYALIPISEALLKWADEIVFMSTDNERALTDEAKIVVDTHKEMGGIVTILNIPDEYPWGDEQLQEEILSQYEGVINE